MIIIIIVVIVVVVLIGGFIVFGICLYLRKRKGQKKQTNTIELDMASQPADNNKPIQEQPQKTELNNVENNSENTDYLAIGQEKKRDTDYVAIKPEQDLINSSQNLSQTNYDNISKDRNSILTTSYSESRRSGQRSWEIKYEELEFGDAIGSGAFGKVYKGVT